MAPRASVKTFLGALVKDTGSLMSGSLSVIAALLALFYNASHARMAFAIFAAICALSATYRIWAAERQQRIAAEQYLAAPDLAIELGRCYRWTGGGGPFVLLETTVTNKSVGVATVKHFTLSLALADGRNLSDGGWTTVDPFNLVTMRDPRTGEENLVNMQTDDLAASLSELMLARGQHSRGYLEFFIPEPLPLSNERIKAELTLTDSLNAVLRSGEQEIWYVGEGWRGGNTSQAHKSPGKV
jgi:hypothetical protein